MCCIKSALVILLIAAGAVLSGSFRQDDARTGFVPRSLPLPLQVQSTTDISGLTVSSPCVQGDTVYIGSRDNCVRALVNGHEIWRFTASGWMDATPVLHQGVLYAASRDGRIYLLDPLDGDSLGVILSGGTQCSSPLIRDSLIIFGNGAWSQDITARHRLTGAYAWHFSIPQMVYSSPAIQDSVLVFGENGGHLTALHAMTGSLLWQAATEGSVYLSTPAISGNTVYFSPGGYDKNLYAFSLGNGSLLWKSVNRQEALAKAVDGRMAAQLLKAGPETRLKLLTFYEKRGLLRKGSAEMTALEALVLPKTGASPFVPLGGNATSSPAVGDSLVYVIHMEYGYPKPRFTLSAFDKSAGTEKWSFSETRNCEQLGFCSSPLVADTLVFAGWGEGKIFAFHAYSGAKLWEDSLSGDVLSSPAAGKDILYVATTAGKLCAFARGSAQPAGFNEGTFCYPNPAKKGLAQIQYFPEKTGDVEVRIFDSAERTMKIFIKNSVPAKLKAQFDWDVTNAANGVYFAIVKITYKDGKTDVKNLKIAVIKGAK